VIRFAPFLHENLFVCSLVFKTELTLAFIVRAANVHVGLEELN